MRRSVGYEGKVTVCAEPGRGGTTHARARCLRCPPPCTICTVRKFISIAAKNDSSALTCLGVSLAAGLFVHVGNEFIEVIKAAGVGEREYHTAVVRIKKFAEFLNSFFLRDDHADWVLPVSP